MVLYDTTLYLLCLAAIISILCNALRIVDYFKKDKNDRKG